MEMDRRNFLKGAGVTAVGAMAAATLGACAPSADAGKKDASAPVSADGEEYLTAATMQKKWSFEIPPEPTRCV